MAPHSFMFVVTTELNTCGIQVEEKASSLNGEDRFVLVTPTSTTVWAGNAANSDEIKTATNIAEKAQWYLSWSVAAARLHQLTKVSPVSSGML